jgi:flagellar biosynthesis anti-sigma factor FlgM
MKIRETNRVGRTEFQKVYPSEQKKSGNQAPVGERIRVSSEAKIIAAAREPEVPDEKKINELKDAIRKGVFKIDYGRIADAMIDEEA